MDLFIQLLISSFPILLLIAVWIYFMRKFSKAGNPQETLIELSRKQLEAQERIAAALETIAERR